MELSERRHVDLNAVLNSLRRITQAIRLSSSAVQDTLGITGAQLFVLQQLAELPGASLRELADRTLTDQSSVSVVVSRLVDGGLVTRRISAADGRRTELSLTGAGRALLRRAPALAQTRLVGGLRAVPASDLHVAARVLTRVAGVLRSTGEPTPMFFEPAAGKRRAAVRPRQSSPPPNSKRSRTLSPRRSRTPTHPSVRMRSAKPSPTPSHPSGRRSRR